MRSLARLTRLDVEYARFNALKTVNDGRPSLFRVIPLGPLTVTRDPNRGDSYYQRVLGLTEESLPRLDDALEALRSAPAVRLDVEESASETVRSALRERGFAPAHRLTWLVAEAESGETPANVLRLSPGEVDRVRPLLELEGSIDPEIWTARREHHCTETFRTFAVESEGALVSMATTFAGEHGTVLGNAFTHPDHRGRGYQSDLLVARLADAHSIGRDHVLTDVEPDTTSHRNAIRRGFRLLHEQAVWESRPPER